MEIKTSLQVDDLLKMLDKDGVTEDSMKYQQGWYIARYIRNKLNTENNENKKEDD